MRLKSFQAPTMAEAMELVREALGAEAIIVSTNEDEATAGVRITAAVEHDEPDRLQASAPPVDLIDEIGEALDRHGVPHALSDKILNAVTLLGEQSAQVALASALDMSVSFKPIAEAGRKKPFLFIGPPGGGKTVTVAKLAAAAVIAQTPACMITTDTLRAGAEAQFRQHGERLGIAATVARDPAELNKTAAAAEPEALVLIDTASANPFDAEDLDRLAGFAHALDAEPVLVLPGTIDTLEAGDIAAAFAPLKPDRLLMTCLDVTGRLGATLTTAHARQIALSEIGAGPAIADPLQPLNPVTLARLLLASSVRTEFLPQPGARTRQASGTD
jgi:flagellar biosynthesis protein FlhF